MNYILERQQIGRNSWKKLGKIGPEPKYRDTDVDHGRKYCYHIRAETDYDISEMMETDDIQAGTKGKHEAQLDGHSPPIGLKYVCKQLNVWSYFDVPRKVLFVQ